MYSHTRVPIYHAMIIFFVVSAAAAASVTAAAAKNKIVAHYFTRTHARTHTHEWATKHTLTLQYTIYIGTGKYASNRPRTPSHRRHRHASWLARDQRYHTMWPPRVWLGAKPSPNAMCSAPHRDEYENERDSRGPRAHCAETELVARAVGPTEIVVIVVVVGGGSKRWRNNKTTMPRRFEAPDLFFFYCFFCFFFDASRFV